MLRPALVVLALLWLLTGVLYPLAVTGAAQMLFPHQARGSIIEKDGRVVGSELIGQSFTSPRFFWSRPSATSPQPYNAAASSGSNYGPTNSGLLAAVEARIGALQAADPANRARVPVDLVTASGSGLDPHISVAAARYQASRVARERSLSEETVHRLIDQYARGRALGFFGEPRVNVLDLNLALLELGEPRPADRP
jgi:K+-transporting ATPase ATPase C chain